MFSLGWTRQRRGSGEAKDVLGLKLDWTEGQGPQRRGRVTTIPVRQRQQAEVVLRRIEGQTKGEIAGQLGLPRLTVNQPCRRSTASR